MATPNPKSGTATPMELDPEQVEHSLKVSLADLSAKAAALYAKKNYEEAAEVYAHAAEMQAEMNGEMNPDNAEILSLYGRALFRVGQSKSNVLGIQASGPKTKPAKPAKKAKDTNGSEKQENGKNGTSAAAPTTTEKVEEVVAEVAKDVAAKKEEPSAEKKPLFHFEGDENFEDSDEEEEEGDDEEDDDDLATAFEICDLARVLFEKKLAQLTEAENDKGKDVSEGDNPLVKHIKERLGDTHHILAEISLENERYPQAIIDCRASLKYKQDLYPESSEIIAEAHFKLSLALEFASVTKSSDDTEGDDQNGDNNAGVVDQALRDEAAVELEAAIASTKLKLQNQEVELATLHNPEDNEITRQNIHEVKEMIADMEQRLIELKKPPIDLNSALGLPAAGSAATVAATSTGQDPEEAKKTANDLSGLVRKKRKAEDVPVEAEGVEAKKVKEGESVN